MYQPCKTCPFREQPVEAGSADWLIDVMKGLIAGGLDHTCHLTDPKADLVDGDQRTKKKLRHCMGYLGMLKRSGNERWIGRRALIAMAKGEIDWAKVPDRGVFASTAACVRHHAEAIGMKFDEKGMPSGF